MCSVLLLWGAVSGAAAQQSSVEQDDERARLHFTTGTVYFHAGDFASAIEEFEQAYSLSPRPRLLYNLSIAHARLSQFEQAAAALERYLFEADDVDNRRELLTRLDLLRRAQASADESEGAGSLGAGVITSLSVAGAGVAVAAVAGPLALSARSDLEACKPDCTDAQVQPVEIRRSIADVGAGVAVAAAIVSLTWWLVRRKRDERTPPTTLLRTSGQGLLLGGRF